MPKNGNANEYSNYCTIELISHASKVMFKILQARLQHYVKQELPDVQGGFGKGRGTRDQIANTHSIIEKAREFQKIYFCFIDNAKAFDWITKWKTLKRDGNTRPPYLFPEKPVCRSRSQLEPDMKQWTGSKLGKEYIKAVYCHHAYLTYMQITS